MHDTPLPSPISDGLLVASTRRLIARWTTVAERLEPFSPPAAAAYRRAADDLARELEKQPPLVELLRSFRDDLVASLQRGAEERRTTSR